MKIEANVKIIRKPFILAPMVDVFFLLLIFFMLSNSVTFWPGMKTETSLQLPRAKNVSMMLADKLIITITASGDIFLNDKAVSWEMLELRLGNLVRESVEATTNRTNAHQNDRTRVRRPLVVLRADKDITNERLTEVMSLARSLNIDLYHLSNPANEANEEERPTIGADGE